MISPINGHKEYERFELSRSEDEQIESIEDFDLSVLIKNSHTLKEQFFQGYLKSLADYATQTSKIRAYFDVEFETIFATSTINKYISSCHTEIELSLIKTKSKKRPAFCYGTVMLDTQLEADDPDDSPDFGNYFSCTLVLEDGEREEASYLGKNVVVWTGTNAETEQDDFYVELVITQENEFSHPIIKTTKKNKGI